MELKEVRRLTLFRKYTHTCDPNVANKDGCQKTENSHDF